MEESSVEERPPVRVALIGCTGLLGDIIGQTVAAEPDFEVVADLPSFDVAGPLPDIDADILLWNNADESLLSQWLDELSSRCGTRVLATHADGREASLWELTQCRTDLGALAPATLAETIRASQAGPPPIVRQGR